MFFLLINFKEQNNLFALNDVSSIGLKLGPRLPVSDNLGLIRENIVQNTKCSSTDSNSLGIFC